MQEVELMLMEVFVQVDIYSSVQFPVKGGYAGKSSAGLPFGGLFPPPRPTTPKNPLLNVPNSRSRLKASNPRRCSRIVFPFRRRRQSHHPNTAKAIAAAKIRK